MELVYTREEKKTHRWTIQSVRYPFSSVESALRIRCEKSCTFCGKKYKDCKAIGVAMTDKGSRPCCDDCAERFNRGLENNH
jgi:hypothetical protein